jgi:hypothetical protein
MVNRFVIDRGFFVPSQAHGQQKGADRGYRTLPESGRCTAPRHAGGQGGVKPPHFKAGCARKYYAFKARHPGPPFARAVSRCNK